MNHKLTATLSDGRKIEVEERDGVLIPTKKEPELKLRPAPKELLVTVCEDGVVGYAWEPGEHSSEKGAIERGELVRYVRDDERYDEHEEWWELHDKRGLVSSVVKYSSAPVLRNHLCIRGGDKLVRVRKMEEVPSE